MEVYNIRKERCDALYRFFIENSKALTTGILLGITSLIGWHYYYDRNDDILMAASSAWQPLSVALSGNSLAQKQLASAMSFADINDNSYGALTSMGLARQFAELGDFPAAEKRLQKAFKQTNEANLKSLINIRLARVQLQQQNVGIALKTLDGIRGEGWIALVEDVRGDAYVIQGDHKAARTAYEKVLHSNAPQALKRLVHMKLNNISS